MNQDINILVSQAKEGDTNALELLVKQIQDKIYGLALRMLYLPNDAEDASQEILIKIITHLSSFKAESSFFTWMYRVATNHLINVLTRRKDKNTISFEEYKQDLDLENAAKWQNSNSDSHINETYLEEVRISCLQGLLLCLDRDHRLAFLLVDVFDVGSQQGAEILGISPAAFRKRLSRARGKMKEFLTQNCALVNPHNPCTCQFHTVSQLNTPRFNEENITFGNHSCHIRHDEKTRKRLREMDELNQIGDVYKTYTDFHAPESLVKNVRDILNSRQYELL
ncbi:MAG: RNA polymerase sigma factor [bacterium]|nr:RNA polymerase sigma factor [bacterium]